MTTEAQRERRLAANRRWRAANPGYAARTSRAWREAHPDYQAYHRLYQRRWRAAHPDAQSARYRRRWERIKADPALLAAHKANRRRYDAAFRTRQKALDTAALAYVQALRKGTAA